MSGRPDDETRRRLRAQYKKAERAEWEAQLPLDPDDLHALLDHLDEALPAHGCDHTQRLTRAWLAEHDHDVDAVGDQLAAMGGACDCEVLANVDPETHM